ncbi:hypothetical protein OOK43_07775 [[Kitasatospora] papulosa]|jgi:hypothetical protein|uniref:hypothetical protein n=1 Tax=Streptomyces TaxID=1883 RepID=UPI00114CD25C|nr:MULTISPECIES: hypothetical protein [Streptomyces]MCX4413185.1 hypothetical protein [[Kitasatospora] papulosa]MYX86785.1 hypothetical protein [Streptomyces sp. SID4915]
MLIAGAWYESGSFWQFAITTLVAVAVGALAAYATMRAANPKRRLGYSARTNASLFIASHSQTGALQVTHNSTPVNRPRIIELELRNAGRHDITATHFHAGEALRFDLGADVVGILGVTSTPSGTVVPAVGIDASVPRVVAIPPSLLARKQVIRATFLVDGPRAEVSCIQAPLIDVAVREGGAAPEPDAHRFTTRVVSATAALSTVYLAMQAFQR